MNNYKGSGKTLTFLNATGVLILAGAFVPVGNVLGVAVDNIPINETGVLEIEGKFSAPKVSAAVFGQGETLTFDKSAGAFDDNLAATSLGDLTGAAIAAEAGTNGQTTCTVILTPGNALLDVTA